MGKNNIDLVAFCKKMVGQRYWFGTYGQIGTEQILKDCANRYQSQFSKKRIDTAHTRGDFGMRVMDCSGLIKNYLMSDDKNIGADGLPIPPVYNATYDLSANVMHTRANDKGPVGDLPEIIGLGLWKNNHVGVYIGAGKVIESRGFDYGVIESTLADTSFVEWFKIPFIEYVENASVDYKPENPAQPAEPVSDDVYMVKAGDTLTSIANMWGCTVDEIAKFNGIDNPDLIIIGQKILKPEGPTTIHGIVCTNSAPLRVRKSTSLQSDVVRLLPKGSDIEIKNIGIVDGDWYALADGTGFVWSSYVKIV